MALRDDALPLRSGCRGFAARNRHSTTPFFAFAGFQRGYRPEHSNPDAPAKPGDTGAPTGRCLSGKAVAQKAAEDAREAARQAMEATWDAADKAFGGGKTAPKLQDGAKN
jgi:hypothetical protein